METARDEGDIFVSSQLLATELHRLGVRIGLDLHSLDAVHIATALDAEADAYLTYDDRQRQGAERAGLTTAAPGSGRG